MNEELREKLHARVADAMASASRIEDKFIRLEVNGALRAIDFLLGYVPGDGPQTQDGGGNGGGPPEDDGGG